MADAVSVVSVLAQDGEYDNGSLSRDLETVGARVDDLIVKLRDLKKPPLGQLLGTVALAQIAGTDRTPALLVELFLSHPTARPMASGWDVAYLRRIAKTVSQTGDNHAVLDLAMALTGCLGDTESPQSRRPQAETVLGALYIFRSANRLPEEALQGVKAYRPTNPREERLMALILGSASSTQVGRSRRSDRIR